MGCAQQWNAVWSFDQMYLTHAGRIYDMKEQDVNEINGNGIKCKWSLEFFMLSVNYSNSLQGATFNIFF